MHNWEDLDGAVSLSALGRNEPIGKLYDARTMKFSDKSLFSTSIPSDLIHRSDISKNDIRYSYSDELSERFQLLNVEPETELGVLLGLIDVSGCAKYLLEERKSEKIASRSVLYSKSRFRETLSYSEKIHEHVNQELLHDENYTHVVVSINWGANVVTTFETTEAQFLECINIPQHGESLNNSENVNVKLFSDVVIDDCDDPNLKLVEKNFDTCTRKILELLESINEDQVKPLNYILVPIAHFKGPKETYFKSSKFDDSFIVALIRFFEMINAIKRKPNDMLISSENDNPSNDDQDDSQRSVNEWELELKKKIGEDYMKVKSEKLEFLDMVRNVESYKVEMLVGIKSAVFPETVMNLGGKYGKFDSVHSLQHDSRAVCHEETKLEENETNNDEVVIQKEVKVITIPENAENDKATLKNEPQLPKEPKELNILIVGQSGVGKSTWINGIINYHRYPTLEDAQQNGVICYIPTNFTITDEKGKEQVVEAGDRDRNEVIRIGQSATQEPRTYSIMVGDKCVRLIDTPGLGDTRGIEKDKENMSRILDHISHLKEIHGICILLKSNESKIDVIFEFCIGELLNSLHKDAAKNIVFCFTNSRSSFYAPGDTVMILRQFLKDSRFDEHITLSESTMFCLDNEAFRYLCTLKYPNLKFLENHRETFQESWEKSVAETERLFRVIENLIPNTVTNIRTICSVRRKILNLAKPIAEMILTICMNLCVLEEYKEKWKSTATVRPIPYIELTPIALEKPRAVCTKCVSYHRVPGSKITVIEYETQCHNECLLNVMICDTYPNPSLKKCPIMDDDGRCQNCRCEWNEHMHVTYEQKRIKSKHDIVDEVEINTNPSDYEELIDQKFQNLVNEAKTIMNISAMFGMFLKQNAIATYNDVFRDYLQHLILQQKLILDNGLIQSTKVDGHLLSRLEGALQVYEKQILNSENMTKGHNEINEKFPLDYMLNLESQLYELKMTGNSLKRNIEEAVKSSELAQTLSEQTLGVYDISLVLPFGANSQQNATASDVECSENILNNKGNLSPATNNEHILNDETRRRERIKEGEMDNGKTHQERQEVEKEEIEKEEEAEKEEEGNKPEVNVEGDQGREKGETKINHEEDQKEQEENETKMNDQSHREEPEDKKDDKNDGKEHQDQEESNSKINEGKTHEKSEEGEAKVVNEKESLELIECEKEVDEKKERQEQEENETAIDNGKEHQERPEENITEVNVEEDQGQEKTEAKMNEKGEQKENKTDEIDEKVHEKANKDNTENKDGERREKSGENEAKVDSGKRHKGLKEHEREIEEGKVDQEHEKNETKVNDAEAHQKVQQESETIEEISKEEHQEDKTDEEAEGMRESEEKTKLCPFI